MLTGWAVWCFRGGERLQVCPIHAGVVHLHRGVPSTWPCLSVQTAGGLASLWRVPLCLQRGLAAGKGFAGGCVMVVATQKRTGLKLLDGEKAWRVQGRACSVALFWVCVCPAASRVRAATASHGVLCGPCQALVISLSCWLLWPLASPSVLCSLCLMYCSFSPAVGFLLAAHAWHTAVACWCCGCPVLPPGVLAGVRALLGAKERTNSCWYIDRVVKYFMLLWQLKF